VDVEDGGSRDMSWSTMCTSTILCSGGVVIESIGITNPLGFRGQVIN